MTRATFEAKGHPDTHAHIEMVITLSVYGLSTKMTAGGLKQDQIAHTVVEFYN